MAIFRKTAYEFQRIPDECLERIIYFRDTSFLEWASGEATMGGVSELVPGYRISRYDTDYGVVIFMLDGDMEVRCQGISRQVHSGEYFYLPPVVVGEQHEYWCECKCRILWFHLKVYEAYWKGIPLSKAYVKHISDVDKILHLFDYIWEEQNMPAGEAMLIRDLLSAMMHLLRRELSTVAASGHHRSEVQTIFQRVAREPQRHWNVASLAKLGNMSVATFSAAVKECYGKSAWNVLMEMRLMKAAKLFSSGNFTLDMVAVQTGFDSGFSLSRAFRRKYGISPREWRNSGKSLSSAVE